MVRGERGGKGERGGGGLETGAGGGYWVGGNGVLSGEEGWCGVMLMGRSDLR